MNCTSDSICIEFSILHTISTREEKQEQLELDSSYQQYIYRSELVNTGQEVGIYIILVLSFCFCRLCRSDSSNRSGCCNLAKSINDS